MLSNLRNSGLRFLKTRTQFIVSAAANIAPVQYQRNPEILSSAIAVGSYEPLMMIIRGAQSESAEVPAAADKPDAVPRISPLHLQAAQKFADEVAAGRMPSVRVIRARLHIGQPRAQRVQAHLGSLTGAGDVKETESS